MSVAMEVSYGAGGFSPPTILSSVIKVESHRQKEKITADKFQQENIHFNEVPKSATGNGQNNQNMNGSVKKWNNDEIVDLAYTEIEGETIACFNVWGEKRLCLPQLLRFVLYDFDIESIGKVCADLQFRCDQCNKGQLNVLHTHGILSKDVLRCGLIRKSDAERLTKVLLYQDSNDLNDKKESEKISHLDFIEAIEVIHNCFGKQRGYFIPELYETPEAACIECSHCYRLFTPSAFVGHTHNFEETSFISHWGFDSSNWKKYLRIFIPKEKSTQDEDILELKQRFDNIKEKFTLEKSVHCHGICQSENNEPTSQWKNSTNGNKLKLPPPPEIFNLSSSGPAPANLHQGTPVLLNPEGVVPRREAANYDRDFAPNVSLAPAKSAGDQPPINGQGDCSVVQDAATLQLIREQIEASVPTDSARTKLLGQFISIQQAYRAYVASVTKENKRLRSSLCEERAIHETTRRRLEMALSQARSERDQAMTERVRQVAALSQEKEALLRQTREAKCPDVHKTRVKYNAVKEEVERITAECKELEEKYRDALNDLIKLRERVAKEETDDGPPQAKKARLDTETEAGVEEIGSS